MGCLRPLGAVSFDLGLDFFHSKGRDTCGGDVLARLGQLRDTAIAHRFTQQCSQTVGIEQTHARGLFGEAIGQIQFQFKCSHDILSFAAVKDGL